MMEIRVARACELEVLATYDRHISGDILQKKVADGQLLVAEEDGSFVGWLRYNFFWDEIPFMNLLYVLEPYQHRGIGTALVLEWEKRMLDAGYDKVMTSTLEEETAQHFYRKLGYCDLGRFKPFAEELELILGKRLIGEDGGS